MAFERKTTRELGVGDQVDVDDLRGTVEKHARTSNGWSVSVREDHTRKLHELEVAPIDVDVPIWDTRS